MLSEDWAGRTFGIWAILNGAPRPGSAFARYIRRRAPIAQLAEAADLKSAQCRFESDWGHFRGSPVGRRARAIARRPTQH